MEILHQFDENAFVTLTSNSGQNTLPRNRQSMSQRYGEEDIKPQCYQEPQRYGQEDIHADWRFTMDVKETIDQIRRFWG